MTSPTRRFVAALSLLLVAGACVGGPKPAPQPTAPTWTEEQDSDDVVRITLVGTNDLHGWIEPRERDSKEGGTPVMGGADILGGYLQILRAKRPGSVVLLDAGDLFQGTLVANMSEGEAIIKAYNLLDYDAAALGNHEFDYGPEGDPVVALTQADDPLGNIKKRIAQARFPFLVGNVFDKASQKPVKWDNAKRSILLERKGIRIGVIGLSTPTTPSVTLAQNVTSLEFKPLLESALELSAELRARGAQIILLTLHAGTGCNPGTDAHDASTCDPKGELYKLLNELPKGTIDAAVAGHTHQYLANFINGTPSIQSSSFGVAFGVVDLWFDKKANKLVEDRTTIWPTTHLCRRVFNATNDCRKEAEGTLRTATFMGEEVVPDEVVADALRPDFKMVERRKNEELGPSLDVPFTRSRVKESELGDLVSDIMRTTLPDTHVAMTNSGGLRADLGVGPLTYGDVFQALPFENRLATLTLKGDELLAMIRQGVSGDHGIVQLSGVQADVLEPGTEPCTAGSGRLVAAKFADGKPIDPAKTYNVVVNDFMAGGGDGFDKVLESVDSERKRVRNDLPPLREIVVTWFRVHPDVKLPDTTAPARIRFVKPACGAAAAKP